MTHHYVCINGNVIPAEEAVFNIQNRSIKYGDGLFETMFYRKGKAILLEKHVHRLLKGMALLKIQTDERLTLTHIAASIDTLCQKNQLSTARIRLQVVRQGEGYYHPKANTFSYILEAETLQQIDYPLNQPALNVDIYPQPIKTCTALSNIKSCSAVGYVLASLHASELGVDDCLVLNSENRICESTHSNIFLIHEGRISTPPLSEGCVAGIMREQLIQIMNEESVDSTERSINLEDLLSAEEVFLTNALRGITSVGSFRGISYARKQADAWQQKLQSSLI